MNSQKIENRLLEIKKEFFSFGNFSIHTMARVEKRAREVKVLAVKAFGRDNKIFNELDSCIEISEKYHKLNIGLECDIIREAIIHLEYSIELFLEKI